MHERRDIHVLLKVGAHLQSPPSQLFHSIPGSQQSEEVGAVAFPCLIEEGDNLLPLFSPFIAFAMSFTHHHQPH